MQRLAGFLASWCLGCCAVWADGPQLEDVPAPRLAGSLPAAAQWPLLRHEEPLRACVIVSKNRPLAVYQRIARRANLRLDVRYTNDGDARYHVNDKWIEPQGDPTNEELTAYCRQLILEALEPVGGRPAWDIVFYDHTARLLKDVTVQQRLRAFLETGGVLVACGNEYPPADGPLADVWPAQPTPQNSWMSGGAKRVPGPELAGVPVERLTGHTWIPLAEPAHGGRALATGESGAMFVREVGQGRLLFVPTGPMSRSWELHAKLGRTWDHDEIWLRAWDQLLHELRGGAKQMPAYADLQLAVRGDRAGQGGALAARLVNRAATGSLTASLHVTSPQGAVVHQREVNVSVAAGAEQTLELEVPIAPSWSAGLYPAYLTLGDPAIKKQLHQALTYLPVQGTVQLALAASKPGYRLGEEAEFTVTASSSTPWQGQLRLGIYDFRGRLLFTAAKPAQLGSETAKTVFTWRVADHGVRVDTFWAVADAVREGTEFARAETKFYQHEPWSMRHEYQWSTWAGIACGSPCAVPAGMRLMAHAGLNSLGYPGQSELSYAAERWGWRYYNEGIGMNTFSPVIDYESDAEIEAALVQEAERQVNSPDLRSAAFVLGSVGEEAGYKTGWGRKYYWDTPVAPDKACRALQWYLKTKYGDLTKLNATWRTNYRSWDEVRLTREFSGPTPKLEADGWARPKESPLGADVTAVSLAPYADTEHFYAWYYDRIIAAAQNILRQRINPVTQTMASAPASWIFNSRECDVRLTGPGAWNESQWHSLDDGLEPGFSLVWGHFDWNVKTENLLWGYLLQRSGHNNYWVDVPLMFNNDLSHTRASLALRRWTARLAGHERAILDSRPAPTDVGVLAHNGISPNATPGNMDRSLRVALLQSGFGFAEADLLPRTRGRSGGGRGDADPADLTQYKILFAPARQALSRADADRLHSYVEQGGMLVFTARFGNQDEFGAPQPVCPGQGLAERWGFAVTEKQDNIPQYGHDTSSRFPLDGLAKMESAADQPEKSWGRRSSLPGRQESLPHVMSGRDVYREKVEADGWTTLASYADQTPAILTRTLGRGRLVYLNAICQSHWYIQWVTPTGPERQGFFRLVEWLCAQAGARRSLRLDGELDQVLHSAVKQFTDETGAIRYVVVRTSGEVPWTNGRLSWLGPGGAAYDVLGNPPGTPARELGREVPLNLRPGDGKWLAVLDSPLHTLTVETEPMRFTPGQPVRITTRLLSERGVPVPGKFPLELRVTTGGRNIAGLARSFSLASSETATLETALSDPPGRWTVTVTDGITGMSGSMDVEAAPDKAATGPGFVSLGWPSEIAEPARLSNADFLDRLRRLSALYLTDQSDQGWKIKQRLGAHYDFFPGTRHDLLRPLFDVDWTQYVESCRAALQAGQTSVLTGEDLNADPATGLAVWPHADGRQVAAVVAVLQGAQWRLGTRDGDTLVATLGKGRLILCRESIDAAGHTNADAARWQQRWRAELAAAADTLPAVKALDGAGLRRWWTGEVSATDAPRTVTWFAGNQREVTLAVDPAKPLDAVFSFVVPSHGKVVALDFDLAADAVGKFAFDVGCCDGADATWALATAPQSTRASALLDWAAAAERYLAWRNDQGGPVRDDSGWRVIPVRVRGTTKATLHLSRLAVTVK